MPELKDDLDSLISSTLDAIEGGPPGENRAPADGAHSSSTDTCQAGVNPGVENDVDALLTRIKEAAPQVKTSAAGTGSLENDMEKLFEDLLTPESIVESMESLALELEGYLNQNKATGDDCERYRKQLDIYKDISNAYKLNENILEDQSPEGERIRRRLSELQSLGSPPPEVVEKLMMSQLPTGGEDGDIAKEFESFLKEAGAGGLLPGLTKEDEDMIKKLTEDPTAFKNLIGGKSGGPGDCSIM